MMFSIQMCHILQVNISWLLFIIFFLVTSIKGSSKDSIQKPSATTMESIQGNNSCSISSLDMCLSTIREVAMDSSLAFPVTKENLNLACWKLKEGDTCADNHMRNCTNKQQKMLFQDIVKGTKKVLDNLCVPGEFQNNYLRYANCYKDVSMSEQKCAGVVKKVQSMNLDPRNTNDMEQSLKKFCCTMKESEDCQIDFVRKDCGERAVIFFGKYMKEISSQLMVDHCATYTYSDSCNPRIDSLSNCSTIYFLFGRNLLVFIILTIFGLFSYIN